MRISTIAAAVSAASAGIDSSRYLLSSEGSHLAPSANATFTQYLCNGTNALAHCMTDITECIASTHYQGACLHSAGGHSLTAMCQASALGQVVDYKLYESSTNCTGAITPVHQSTDVCQQGGGGAYFVKLECSK